MDEKPTGRPPPVGFEPGGRTGRVIYHRPLNLADHGRPGHGARGHCVPGQHGSAALKEVTVTAVTAADHLRHPVSVRQSCCGRLPPVHSLWTGSGKESLPGCLVLKFTMGLRELLGRILTQDF